MGANGRPPKNPGFTEPSALTETISTEWHNYHKFRMQMWRPVTVLDRSRVAAIFLVLSRRPANNSKSSESIVSQIC